MVLQDGIILIDKPAGITSHDVVAGVRRTLGVKIGSGAKTKVGHAGTLDPFATGLLIVLVGQATKVQQVFMKQPKSYSVVARLGWKSTTGDPEGEISEGATPSLPLELPTGLLKQQAPAYSAVKINGKRAYKLAREGKTFERPVREIVVSRFEQTWEKGEEAAFEIDCTSGTYVRTLITDFNDAYCTELRRVAIGPFRVEDSDPDKIIPLKEALARVP